MKPVVIKIARNVPFAGRLEPFLLRQAWATGSAEMLDSYLVSGYQNPRINVQSILLRHFLARKLGGSFEALMDDEIRFAIELNETLRLRAKELDVAVGSFLDAERAADVRRVEESIEARQHEFERRWATAWGDGPRPRLSVLEFACGSANDYRAFVDYGLAPYLDYRGVDLTTANIANARRRFPDTDFEVGDILNLPLPNASVDYVIASDIFEHLSIDAMQRALDEATRLATRGLLLTFFKMGEDPDHVVQKKRTYHWNTLSRMRIEERLSRNWPKITTIHVRSWLREKYGYEHSYNSHAYSIFAER
jgi:ubiquinone/menaquinone biosynthesis C-methylase UbiE